MVFQFWFYCLDFFESMFFYKGFNGHLIQVLLITSSSLQIPFAIKSSIGTNVLRLEKLAEKNHWKSQWCRGQCPHSSRWLDRTARSDLTGLSLMIGKVYQISPPYLPKNSWISIQMLAHFWDCHLDFFWNISHRIMRLYCGHDGHLLMNWPLKLKL